MTDDDYEHGEDAHCSDPACAYCNDRHPRDIRRTVPPIGTPDQGV